VSRIDAGEPSKEAQHASNVMERLDQWDAAYHALKARFRDFSPWDVMALTQYLQGGDPDDE